MDHWLKNLDLAAATKDGQMVNAGLSGLYVVVQIEEYNDDSVFEVVTEYRFFASQARRLANALNDWANDSDARRGA